MCLILIAWRQRNDLRLILAANRDEYYDRPTDPARLWNDAPHILAGRDRRAGGTWLGVDRSGRYTAVTNIREPSQKREGLRSRGLLTTGYLDGNAAPGVYSRQIAAQRAQYDSFNFIAGDRDDLWFLNSSAGEPAKLPPGVYGISNGELDCLWPKVLKGKAELQRLLNAVVPPVPLRDRAGERESVVPGKSKTRSKSQPCRHTLLTEPLFRLLADRTVPADGELPDTGVGIEWERRLAPAFIAAGQYGTRSSTVIILQHDGTVHFSERSFDSNGRNSGESVHAFRISE